MFCIPQPIAVNTSSAINPEKESRSSLACSCHVVGWWEGSKYFSSDSSLKVILLYDLSLSFWEKQLRMIFFFYKKLTKLLETKVEDSDCNMYLPKPRGSVGELPSSSFRTTQVLPGSTDGLRVESVGLVVITSPLPQLSGFFNCKLIISGSFSGQRNNKNRWRKKGDTFPLRNLWRDRL